MLDSLNKVWAVWAFGHIGLEFKGAMDELARKEALTPLHASMESEMGPCLQC